MRSLGEQVCSLFILLKSWDVMIQLSSYLNFINANSPSSRTPVASSLSVCGSGTWDGLRSAWKADEFRSKTWNSDDPFMSHFLHCHWGSTGFPGSSCTSWFVIWKMVFVLCLDTATSSLGLGKAKPFSVLVLIVSRCFLSVKSSRGFSVVYGGTGFSHTFSKNNSRCLCLNEQSLKCKGRVLSLA